MSLEKIDQYLSELEAVKFYGQVKEENQKFKSKNTELKKRITELEQMKVTSEGKTIKEAEEACLRAEEEEINKKAEEKSNEIYGKWQKDEKPKEVFDTSVRELRRILSTFRGTTYVPVRVGSAQPRLDEEVKQVPPAQPKLDVEVNKILNLEVQKRLGEEFKKSVEARSNEIASQKLEELKKLELKKWHDEKVMPEIARLDTVFRESIIAFLRDTEGLVTCDKCGTPRKTKFMGQMVSDLMTKGKFNLDCINPNCKDPFTGRHQIPITLIEIIDDTITHKSGYP